MRQPFTFYRKVLFLVVSLALFFFISYQSTAQMRSLYLDTLKEDNKVNKFSFYSPSEGYISSLYWIGYTADSGHTIVKKYITLNNVDYNGHYEVNLTFGFGISGIKAFSRNDLIVYGDYGFVPAILTSKDGGNSFKLVFLSLLSPLAFNEGITDMVFPGNGNTGFAADADRILKTPDKGVSWTVNSIQSNIFINHFEAIDNNYVYAHNTSFGIPTLLKTTNAGVSWQKVNIPAGNELRSVSFLTKDKGWLNIDEKLYRTLDGGASWTLINDPVISPSYGKKMHFVNDSTGYKLGGLFTTFKTTDGGKIWERLPRNNSYSYLYYNFEELFCWDEKLLWAGGGHGFIEISNTGGGKPIPSAYFTVDTSGFSTSNTVDLINHSKTGHNYAWYKNDTLISNDYHTSYQHINVYKEFDTLMLIVSNSSGKDTAIHYQRFNLPPPPPPPHTGWVEKTTRINDNLLDVRFFGNYGLIVGEKGLYYTTTGADDSNGWDKYLIKGAKSDSLILAGTTFKQLTFDDTKPVFYACGTDTVHKKAVLFKLDLTNLTYQFLYTGVVNSSFNAMTYFADYIGDKGTILAVGNNGLYINYSISSNKTIVSTIEGKENLIGVFFRKSYEDATQIGVISANTLFVGSPYFTLSFKTNLERTIKDAASVTSSNDYVLADKKVYYLFTSSTLNKRDSIYRIKDTSVIFNSMADAQYGTMRFLATSKGIYKLNTGSYISGTETIEYQDGSNGKYINNIWFKTYAAYDTGYAVGKNGILMKTENFGGPTVPYASISSQGNCLGTDTYLYGIKGTATDCKWYVDNNLVAEDCSGTFFRINTEGFHDLRYVVSNAYGLADTAYSRIYISSSPETTLKLTVPDSILCKSESTSIIIQQSQSGYYYELFDEKSNKSFGKVAGNGGTITLKSMPIAATSTFYFMITSINGGCAVKSTNRFKIIVEHTRSGFASNELNITESQAVNFYQRSFEAASFEWQFNDGASIASSTNPNPANISYAESGQKTLRLISTSTDGCRDTLESNTVFVYKKPIPDEACYIQNIEDSDYNYYAGGPLAFQKITVSKNDDYFIAGAGKKPVLKSRYGNSVAFNGDQTGYFARYSADGVLKWYSYMEHSTVNSVAEDANGNIYVTGYMLTKDYFHFSNGDSMRLTAIYETDTTVEYYKKYNGFVLKMDPAGNYLWHSIFYDPTTAYELGYPGVSSGYAGRLIVNNNHIFLTGGFGARFAYAKNGVKKILYDFPDSSGYSKGYFFLAKIDDSGNLLWSSILKHTSNNGSSIDGLTADAQGNVYCAGYYEINLTINNADGSKFGYLPGTVAHFSGYLIKYNADGKVIWYNTLNSGYEYGDSKFNAAVCDKTGNVYATGESRGSSANQQIVISRSDGMVATDTLNTYLLVKFDSNGKYLWSAGSKGGYYGAGRDLQVKDNEVFTIGEISKNGIPTSTFEMTSANHYADAMTIGEAEFFIAAYDLDGSLNRIVKSGSGTAGHVTTSSLRLDNKGNFIAGGIMDQYNNGTGTYSVFGNTVKTNGNDAFYTKLNPDFCTSAVRPVAIAGPAKTICGGNSVIIGTDSIAGSSYRWTSRPEGFISTSSNPKVSPLQTTIYYLSVTNASGFFARDSVTVFTSGSAIAKAGADTTICAGQTMILGTTATAGDYKWVSIPAGFTSEEAQPMLTATDTRTYYVTVINGNCSSKDSITVTVNPTIEIVAINTLISKVKCENDEARFEATVLPTDCTIKWLENGREIFPSQPTDYTLLSIDPFTFNDSISFIATPKAGCFTKPNVQSNIIVSTAAPLVEVSVTITASEKSICPGEPVTFTAVPENAGTVITYQWTVNGVAVGSNSNSFTTSSLANNDEVKVMLNTNVPCAINNTVSSNSIIVKVGTVDKPTATIEASATEVCGSNTTISFTVSADASAYNTIWYRNEVEVSAEATYSSSFNNNDKVYAIVTALSGCFSSFTDTSNIIAITVKDPVTPLVSIQAAKESICKGTAASFTATVTAGGASPVFDWRINGSSTGVYTADFTSSSLNDKDNVQLHITSSESCTLQNTALSNTVVMHILNSPTAFAGNDQTVCPGAQVSLGKAVSGDNYSWTSIPAGFSASIAYPVAMPLVSTQYIFTVTNSGGCEAKDTVMIATLPSPVANAGGDKNICTNSSPVLIGTAAQAGSSYAWSPVEGLSNAGVAQPDALPVVNTTYHLLVTGLNGCTSGDSMHVKINVPEQINFIDTVKTTCIGTGIRIGVTNQPEFAYSWSSVPPGFISTEPNPFVTPLETTFYTLTRTNRQTGCQVISQIRVIADSCKAGIGIIFPNPAIGYVTVQLTVNDPEPKYFELVDPSGIVVLTKQLTGNTTTMNVSAFGAGVYYYRIVGSGKVLQSGKIIILH